MIQNIGPALPKRAIAEASFVAHEESGRASAVPKRMRREAQGMAQPNERRPAAAAHGQDGMQREEIFLPQTVKGGPSANDLFSRGARHIRGGKWEDAELYWSIARKEMGKSSMEVMLSRRSGPCANDVQQRAVLLYHAAMGHLEHGTKASCQLACFRLRASQALFPQFYPALLALGIGEVLLGHRQAAQSALSRGRAAYIRLTPPGPSLMPFTDSNELVDLVRFVVKLRLFWTPATSALARMEADTPLSVSGQPGPATGSPLRRTYGKDECFSEALYDNRARAHDMSAVDAKRSMNALFPRNARRCLVPL